MAAITAVAVWHFGNSWASFHSKTVARITEAEPTVLVEDGAILQEALASERLSEEELYSQLRLMEIDDLQEVKTATLEPNGHISVIKQGGRVSTLTRPGSIL